MDKVNGPLRPKDGQQTDQNGWQTELIDVCKYLPELAGIEASDAEKIELLETLCAILRACIDLQLGGDTYVQLIDTLERASQDSADPVLSTA